MSLNPPQDYRKTRFIHRRGTRVNQPLASDVLDGTLYFVTDELTLERSNGVTWESYASTGGSGSSVDLEPVWIDGGEPSGSSFFGYNILDGGTP